MKKSNQAPTELSLDSLDKVVGGKGTGTINGTLGLGPVSLGLTYDLQNHDLYLSGGLSRGGDLKIGGWVTLGVVIPYNRDTPASEVISGPSLGAEGYFGGGGGISANTSGMTIYGGSASAVASA